MPLATKNNALIVKDGKIAENCGCCGCFCQALSSVQVTLQWLPSNITSRVLDACGKSGMNPFIDIPDGVTYTLPVVTVFPVNTVFGQFSQQPNRCYYFYKDASITGSTSIIDMRALPPVTVNHGLELLVINQQDPQTGQKAAEIWVRFASQVICNINTTSQSNQPYADGFSYYGYSLPTQCGSFSTAITPNNFYWPAKFMFILADGLGDGYYSWAVRGTISGSTNPLP